MVDRERALHLLLGRYRYEEAMRLFGEYCLLLEEDWNDFIARHSPPRLRQLHRPLSLRQRLRLPKKCALRLQPGWRAPRVS